MAKIKIDKTDLINNPLSKVPVCLVLDCSPSMSGDPEYGYEGETPQTDPSPIEELNKGVNRFITSITGAFERESIEVCIIAFSGQAREILPFTAIQDAEPPVIKWNDKNLLMEIVTDGYSNVGQGTNIGNAIKLALKKLSERKILLKKGAGDYKQPQMIILTDGNPTDESHVDVSKTVREMVENKKLTVYAIGVGSGVNMDILAMLNTEDKPPKKLKGLRFKQMFEFLSKTMGDIATAPLGKQIPYAFTDKEKIKETLNFVED